MSDQVILNNISDDAQSKQYISDKLLPEVFHDIPLSTLNTGAFSVVSEYMSQVAEQLGFTSAFYFNESFITKAVLPDSVYSEAAIFNIGYAFANASTTNFLLELKIEDIYRNAKLNVDGLYEFILDKNTKFNLSNGNVYSLDYDILIQYMDIPTSDNSASIPSWNVQYLKMDDMNSISVNKDTYIMYRVTDTWLCLFIKASEYVRETHTVVNNMTNGVPNQDTVITCENNICGFDIKYITTDADNNTVETWIPHDHILPIHSNVKDQDPYVNYIMDNPHTIRFMYQLSGNRYFIPKLNSRFEIIIYTCHGEAANFTGFKQDEQPSIITESNRYPNNGNVMKTAFVLTASSGGTDIGNMEMVRRQTIEAYNTANIISTDHDIQEWFKTFFFKNILYPFFYKRRDDPWGRVWAGFIALKDDDNTIFRTNTLHATIPYRVLYNNNDNTVVDNEVIIPPGWLWVYSKDNRYTVKPYIRTNNTIETAKTMSNIPDRFVFANPFGIRIQKQPFSIGYFNPWINSYTTTSHVEDMHVNTSHQNGDLSIMYHATPLFVAIQRTYENDYYNITTYINPTLTKWIDDSPLAKYVRYNASTPKFVGDTWNYFREPLDMYATSIPMCRLASDGTYIPFDPEKTYLCAKSKNISTDGTKWTLNSLWIDDYTNEEEPKACMLAITGDITKIYGLDSIWGNDDIVEGISYSDDTAITLMPSITSDDPITFTRVSNKQYYEMRLRDNNVNIGDITKIVVSEAYKTELTKYNETNLYRIGDKYSTVFLNIYFKNDDTERCVQYRINNAAEVLIPYTPTINENDDYVFELDQVGPNGVILYADMRPSNKEGAYDYYRIKLSNVDKDTPMFYIGTKSLPTIDNNMRVVLHALHDGNEVGWVEMQPVFLEPDGSYKFDVKMYPIDKLVDVNNSIRIATTTDGGGSWNPSAEGSSIYIDAEHPEFIISILVRTPDIEFNPGINLDDSFKGFRVVDQYSVDNISLVQELKEMRSVVNWGETSEPTEAQIYAYDNIMNLSEYNPNGLTFYDIRKYAYNKMHYNETEITFSEFKTVCASMVTQVEYLLAPNITAKAKLQFIIDFCMNIKNSQSISDDIVVELYNEMKGITTGTWTEVYKVFDEDDYADAVNETFAGFNVNGGLEIQLTPFVASDLMTSTKFAKFVTAFTTVHKSIEPVIFNRLEGNNYLDCKLIATYGLPHSYTSDVDKDIENSYWPDLDVQIEFDVKLYNNAIASNTLNELKIVIRDYFNRLTSIHTPVDVISMDNNIYISNLIDQMKDNENVAYLKFKGWYTNDKGHGGKYMNADYQAIVQKWDKLDDMPTDELTRFVPEMFVLDDDNIVLNII